MAYRLNISKRKSVLSNDLKSAATPSSIFKHFGFDESKTKLYVYKMAYVQLMCADDLQHRLKALIDSGRLKHNASRYIKQAYSRLKSFNKSVFKEDDMKSLMLLDMCDDFQEGNEFDKKVDEFAYQIELLNSKSIKDDETRKLYSTIVACQAIVQQSMKINNDYFIDNETAMENVKNFLSCALNYLVPTKPKFTESEQSAFDMTCKILKNTAISTFVFKS